MSLRVRLGLILGAVVSIAFLWLTDVPLGVPGEWTWDRIRFDDDRLIDSILGCGVACAAAGVYVWLAWLGSDRVGGCTHAERTAWLVGLVIAGFAWLWFAQGAPPREFRSLKPMWVLYDPGASGYFFEACHGIDDARSFLASYEQRMAGGDVLHVGTHPPGLFLLHYGLISVCRASDTLSQLILETQPDSVGQSFREVERGVRLTPLPPSQPEEAALWLAVLLTQLVAAATVVPLYRLLRLGYSRQTSWMCATFWPLVPALAVFLPKSDALYPCVGMLFVWAWLEGWRRGSTLLWLLAGLLLWAGLFCSLALLPAVPVAVVLTLWKMRLRLLGKPAFEQIGKLVVAVAWGGAGFLVPASLLWIVGEVNIFSVWNWNYHNHAAFYDEYQRTYWKWLLVNPVEAALAAGLPLVVLTVASYAQCLGRTNGLTFRQMGPYGACAVVWGLLWLSGKNMGEAARLWLVLMPTLVWLAAKSVEPRLPAFGKFQGFVAARGESATARRARMTGWLPALALQAVVCIATVARVDGFHLDQAKAAETSPAEPNVSAR